MRSKSLDKLYLGEIIFKPDEGTDSAIRELSEFLLRWYRRVGLPSKNKKDLKKLQKYVNNKNVDEDSSPEFKEISPI